MDFWIVFANFFASAIRLTAPIALGTLACTISERAGVINIGIEGSMLFSGFLAAVGSLLYGQPLGWAAMRLYCWCISGTDSWCTDHLLQWTANCNRHRYQSFWPGICLYADARFVGHHRHLSMGRGLSDS